MRATLSILGLYNYNVEIFSGLQVPDGLDRATLIEYIMMECAELEILYPEPSIMQLLVTAWAKARRHSWERLYQTTVQNYNMIHNYDRYEEWTDNGSSSRSGTHNNTSSGQESSTLNGNISNTQNSRSDTSQTTQKPGYNLEVGTVTTEIVTGNQVNSGSSNAQNTETSTGTSSGNQSGSEAEQSQTLGSHSGHLYGNIGVTTAAQMLDSERELYKWDVYAAIAQEFKERFCVMVY